MRTTTKQVTTSMTFEVTVHLSAIETADETGADISEVEFDGVEIEGVTCDGSSFSEWELSQSYMEMIAAQKGDWNHD